MPIERRVWSIASGICLLIFTCITTSSAASRWSQTYGGPETFEQVWELFEVPDGTVLVGGVTDSYGTQTGDAWRIRIDGEGAVLEERVYGNALPGGAADIAFDPDGGMAVVGAHTLDIFEDRDAWIHHVDADGVVDWGWSFDFDPGLHAFYGVARVSDGGYIATGSSAANLGVPIYAWVVRFDSAGNVLWENLYNGGLAEHPNFVVETSDGGFAMAGWTTSSGAGSTDVWLLKIDAAGAIEWQKTYGGADQEEATGLVQTADGGYAISAFTDTYPSSGHGALILRVDSSGNLLWNAVMGDEWGDFRDVVQTEDGGLVATGRVSGPSSNDLWVVKFRDSDGAVLWQRTYEGSQGDWGSRTIELSGNDLLIAGIWAFGFAAEDIWLQRTDSFGVIPSCGLIRDSEVVTTSPEITVQPAITSISEPLPSPFPETFVEDVSTLGIDEKCRAATSVEEPGSLAGVVGGLRVAPNPVRNSADISFRLETPGQVTLTVHDSGGRLVETLVDGDFVAGQHHVDWQNVGDRDLAAGVYFLSLSLDGRDTSRRTVAIVR